VVTPDAPPEGAFYVVGVVAGSHARINRLACFNDRQRCELRLIGRSAAPAVKRLIRQVFTPPLPSCCTA